MWQYTISMWVLFFFLFLFCFVFLTCRLLSNSPKDPWWTGQGPRVDGKWPGHGFTCFTSWLIYYPSWRPSKANLLAIYFPVPASSPRLLSGEHFNMDGWFCPVRETQVNLNGVQLAAFLVAKMTCCFQGEQNPMVISGEAGGGWEREQAFACRNPGPSWACRRGFPGCTGGTGRTSPLRPPIMVTLSVLSCFEESFPF